MVRAIVSPNAYVQGKDEFKNFGQYTQDLGEKGAYLIVDPFIHDNYKDEIVTSLEESKIEYKLAVFGGQSSKEEIQKHRDNLGELDVIFGIGGGKTIDTAKAVAHYEHLPIIVAPTAASTDAPTSRLSVLYKESGEFDEYLFLKKNPDMVVMDTSIIAKAPVKFIRAGIGDALATYYEAAACIQSNAETMAGGHVTLAAEAISQLCLQVLLEDGAKAIKAVEAGVFTKAVDNIIEANTYLSGIGFESSGLAAAHAIHNGLTTLKGGHESLHGELVAFGTVSQMVLENRPLEEIEEIIVFTQEVGLKISLKDLGLGEVSDEELMKAAEASCAEGDTMGNMPFEVLPEDVVAAMKTANVLIEELS